MPKQVGGIAASIKRWGKVGCRLNGEGLLFADDVRRSNTDLSLLIALYFCLHLQNCWVYCCGVETFHPDYWQYYPERWIAALQALFGV